MLNKKNILNQYIFVKHNRIDEPRKIILDHFEDMDEKKSRNVNYFEIVNIDVLEARDCGMYKMHVYFFIRQKVIDFRSFLFKL